MWERLALDTLVEVEGLLEYYQIKEMMLMITLIGTNFLWAMVIIIMKFKSNSPATQERIVEKHFGQAPPPQQVTYVQGPPQYAQEVPPQSQRTDQWGNPIY